MRFTVETKVFEILPDACFGVVVARNLENSGSNTEVWSMLGQAIEATRIKF